MNKVFFGTLLSEATSQIRTLTVHVSRAQSNFLTEKSIDLALNELKETQKLLEQARDSYLSSKPITTTQYLK